MNKKLIALGIMALMIAGAGYGLLSGNPVVKEVLDENGNLLFVSGTEYAMGENGSTIVRVTNALGGGISANWCNVTIYYPDKTIWVNNTAMSAGGATGSWYQDFVTPNIIGIYEQWVKCSVPVDATERIIENSKAFHVSEPLSKINVTEEYPEIIIVS